MAMAATILYTLSFILYRISVTTPAPANAVSPNPALSLTQLNVSTVETQNLTSRFAVRINPILKATVLR